jgi:hypothetical protein
MKWKMLSSKNADCTVKADVIICRHKDKKPLYILQWDSIVELLWDNSSCVTNRKSNKTNIKNITIIKPVLLYKINKFLLIYIIYEIIYIIYVPALCTGVKYIFITFTPVALASALASIINCMIDIGLCGPIVLTNPENNLNIESKIALTPFYYIFLQNMCRFIY